jgi:uncharacterized protein
MASYQQTIFVNLPVTNLSRSLAFYTALGFVQNKTFSNETSAMLSLPLSKDSNAHESPIKIMILEHSFYKTFCPEGMSIPDTQSQSGCMIALSRESREAVDEMEKKAGEAGGKIGIRVRNEMEQKMADEGVMYGCA